MHYKIGISNPVEHFMGVQWQIKNDTGQNIRVQLPSWRPGRYELASYAKNIRCFTVKDKMGSAIQFKKVTKDCWDIFSEGHEQVQIEYEYYANQYDAGASYVDGGMLYINPVNCMMYIVGRMDEPATIELDVPDDYKIACQLRTEGKTIFTQNFDELADSPFVASAQLTHTTFKVNDGNIHLWFQGQQCPDMDRLIADTKTYTEAQIKIFGEMPCKDFHFLYLILKTTFRHGVEHTDSTVIAMGPESDWKLAAFYDNFVAISSHELFHLWNVKRIRPEEMLPYDFTKENYSELGYIYEGITTYYGDLVLLRSGVWSFEQYCESFNGDLQKHLANPGRFNYSVAESSFDTWLDGYVPGVKGRKVSIYTEGMLAALVADVMIIKASGGKARLDDVMKALYEQTFKAGKGYTKTLYRSLLEKYAGISFQNYFDELIDGCGYLETHLKTALHEIGLTYIFELDALNNKVVKLLKQSNQTAGQQYYFEIWCKKP
ncbi:MAG: M61 family metallopeptidase [Bacteroidia bacterium]|nr:M61 family metallopeptidase [Bacteroidia bacterium]